MSNQPFEKPMSSIWLSLVWKEWHEHKWKLAILSVTIFAFGLFWIREPARIAPEMLSVTLLCYSLLAGLLVGMYTAGGENGRGTMRFLQTLPVSMSRPALVKLLMTLTVTAIPMLLTVVATALSLHWQGYDTQFWIENERMLLQAGPLSYWGIQPWYWGVAFSAFLTLASLLLWMVALGVNRSDEIRAGAVGFLGIAAIWFCLAVPAALADRYDRPWIQDLVAVLAPAAPGAPGNLESFSESLDNQISPVVSFWLLAVISLFAHCLVARRFLMKFGTRAMQPSRSAGGLAAPVAGEWLAPPRASTWRAIVWKQLMETGPLALLAAGAILCFAAIGYYSQTERGFRNSFGEILAGVTLGVGYLVTVAAGMGVFLEDLKPKVSHFRRALPASPTQWFFIKFFTGLLVLAITFGLLILFSSFFTFRRSLLDEREPVAQVFALTLVFTLLYTMAVVSYCLGRHPVVSALAAIGVMVVGSLGINLFYYYLLPEALSQDGRFAFGLAIAAQLGLTVLAWKAFRENWGWHAR